MDFNTNGPGTQKPKKSGAKASLIWLLIVFMMTLSLVYALRVDPSVTDTEYFQIVKYFDEHKVSEYSLNFGSRRLSYVLEGEKERREYTVPNVSLFVSDIHESVREYNKEHPDKPIKMDYSAGASASWLMEIVPMAVLTLALILIFWWLIKRMNTGLMNEGNRTMAFGKARLKSGSDENRRTTFDDVAGVDEEKEDLREIVEFLKAPEKFNDLGARIPKGVLLIGPPGTGKTLLARAVAGEANATFLSISGSDFVEMYVGVGASRVRDLFDTAKKNIPAIIFIDEIDAVGRHRGAGMGGGHDEREQTLNQLLVEMDGFGANTGVIILAATNRPDILDPALLRPGRFDRQIAVNFPDLSGREAILKVHAKNKPLGPDVSLKEVAAATSGFTGADLENLLNEAALLAAKYGRKAITKPDIEEATVKVVVGTEKKSKKISDKEKRLTAYHEAGHAVTSFYLESLDPVHQISVIPRGMAGGYTMSLPEEDKRYVSKKYMLDELVSLLGGRVAEAVVLGDISTGASNDIERATSIARSMVTKYGMSEKLGPIAFGNESDEVFLGKTYNHIRNYSESTASAIDREIALAMNSAYDRAQEILRTHIDKLHKLAQFLIRFEKIEGSVFRKIMEDEDFTVEKYQNELNEKAEKEEKARKARLARNRRRTDAAPAKKAKQQALRLPELKDSEGDEKGGKFFGDDKSEKTGKTGKVGKPAKGAKAEKAVKGAEGAVEKEPKAEKSPELPKMPVAAGPEAKAKEKKAGKSKRAERAERAEKAKKAKEAERAARLEKAEEARKAKEAERAALLEKERQARQAEIAEEARKRSEHEKALRSAELAKKEKKRKELEEKQRLKQEKKQRKADRRKKAGLLLFGKKAESKKGSGLPGSDELSGLREQLKNSENEAKELFPEKKESAAIDELFPTIEKRLSPEDSETSKPEGKKKLSEMSAEERFNEILKQNSEASASKAKGETQEGGGEAKEAGSSKGEGQGRLRFSEKPEAAEEGAEESKLEGKAEGAAAAEKSEKAESSESGFEAFEKEGSKAELLSGSESGIGLSGKEEGEGLLPSAGELELPINGASESGQAEAEKASETSKDEEGDGQAKAFSESAKSVRIENRRLDEAEGRTRFDFLHSKEGEEALGKLSDEGGPKAEDEGKAQGEGDAEKQATSEIDEDTRKLVNKNQEIQMLYELLQGVQDYTGEEDEEDRKK